MIAFIGSQPPGNTRKNQRGALLLLCVIFPGTLLQPVHSQQYRGWEFNGEYEGVGYYTRFLEREGDVVLYEVKLSNFRDTAIDAINCRSWTAWQNSTRSWEQIYPETIADVLGKRYCRLRPKSSPPDA